MAQVREPLVSIIMPAYNAARFIRQSIQSILQQSFQDWELLVTDDASTDNTPQILEQAAREDARIRIFLQTQNQGPGAARNHSLSHARGRYLAFLDSDDLWLPHKLEKQLPFMQKQQAAFTFASYSLINQQGEDLHKTIHAPASITYRQYLRNTIIGCLTVMIDREKTGPVVMPDMKTSQDMATWLDILRNGIIGHGMPEVLAQYRIVDGSNTSSKWKSAMDVWRVYRQHEGLSLPASCFNFAGYCFNAIKKRL